jgi:hypothetical protein
LLRGIYCRFKEITQASITMNSAIANQPEAAKLDPQKLPYQSPQLKLLGDVRDVTLGGTAGTGDSGTNPGAERF